MSEDNEIGNVSFSHLLNSRALLEAMQRLGFSTPTPAQELAIPVAFKRRDFILHAKTGSGKTLAFGLPMLSLLEQALQERKINSTYGLVIAPTRELAIQIAEVFTDLLPDLTPTLLIGGTPYPKQKRQLVRDPRIVIGTPGRVLDFIDQRLLDLNDCDFFVLDEADEMFSMGFYEDVQQILGVIPTGAQGVFVSATISSRIRMLAKNFLHDAEQIVAHAHEDEDEFPPIEHLYCNVGPDVPDKPTALCDLIEHLEPESAIIFCNTRSETELVEAFLRRRGYDARRINSDLRQNERNRIMKRIRAKELRFLVATDIAARGIDIALIELIVNFSISDKPESYVHRTGRTGRAGHKGKAISLVSSHDFMAFKALKKEISVELTQIELPTEDQLAVARLARLEKNLESFKENLHPRNRALAQLILDKCKDSSEEPAQIEEYIALLVQFVLENLVNAEVLSLEEELKKSSSHGNRSNERGSKKSRSRRARGRQQGHRSNR